MATQIETELLPIDVPLPEPPSASFLTETQWKTWYALMDTVIPSVVTSEGGQNASRLSISSSLLDTYYDVAKTKLSSPPSRAEFEAYLLEKPSENEAFRTQTVRTLHGLPKDSLEKLGYVLNLLA